MITVKKSVVGICTSTSGFLFVVVNNPLWVSCLLWIMFFFVFPLFNIPANDSSYCIILGYLPCSSKTSSF